ncbi:hypothetical protein LP419_05990 [Massilia sp. H-1]|nr:hypothetical protein LP419_05990 [Massilia sp. H-1]
MIVTQPGRGSIVSSSPVLDTAQWEEQLNQSLDQAARLGQLLGLAPDALASRLYAAIQHLKEE